MFPSQYPNLELVTPDTPLRIAFVIINANLREGTSRAVIEVAQRLCASGHIVDLWARRFEKTPYENSDQNKFEQNKGNCKLTRINVPGPSRPEVVDFESFRWACNKRLHRHKYDIIHSAGVNTALADVYTVQTIQPEKIRQIDSSRASAKVSRLRRLFWRIYDQRVVAAERNDYRSRGPRGPRYFLPVAEGTARELVSYYPQAVSENGVKNICVIPNGADLELFNPNQRERHRSDVRREHSIAEDAFLLVFTGGDWRRKGLDLLLGAIPMLSNNRAALIVVGNDRAGADIRQLCTHLGLDDRVRFVGFRDDVHRYYAAGDLFVFPTLYEAFSLSSIEAAASGLPVLISDVSGAAELVGAGDTGTIIERNSANIASVIDSYIYSPELLRNHGQAARALVEKTFNWDAIAKQTLEVYKQLISVREKGSL